VPESRAPRSAFATALVLLTARALTAAELAARLRRRGFSRDEIAETRARLEDLGYLDDRRTAGAWADAAARVRGLGPRRVREGLARRRVGREIAAEASAEAFPPGEEERLAGAALEKWERARGRAATPEARRRPSRSCAGGASPCVRPARPFSRRGKSGKMP